MRKYVSGTAWCIWRWTETDSQYLTRLHVLKTPFGAIDVHWIHKPDPELHCHDHPVTFLSIILRGGYLELRNKVWKNRKWFNFIWASKQDIHRIIHVEPHTVTLCFMGPKTREWGFHTPDKGWIYWKDYYAAARAAGKVY